MKKCVLEGLRNYKQYVLLLTNKHNSLHMVTQFRHSLCQNPLTCRH